MPSRDLDVRRGYVKGRAGFPTTVTPGATSFVTTAPAPTIAPLPIRTPHRIVAPDPIDASSSTQVSSSVQSLAPFGEPSALHARGCLSFTNVTPCPTNTRSATCTPSQMNVCVEFLQCAPIVAPRWISTNAPTREYAPIVQP